MMARQFESGFFLVERCHRELPALEACFRRGTAMRAALADMVDAATRIEALLRMDAGTGASEALNA